MSHINVGTGIDVTIKELAETVKAVVGFMGQIGFDNTKPDGTSWKLMNVTKLNDLGWRSNTALKLGLQYALHDFVSRKRSFGY